MALDVNTYAAPANFACLPTELLVKVMLELDWRTVLRLQLVNAELNEIIKTHTAVQYHVELGIAGMVDGPSFPHACFNTGERLARLRLYQSRWKHFNHTRVQTIRHARAGVWELASGVLAQGISSGVGELAGGLSEVRKLFFTKLPSSARVDSKAREWNHDGYEFPIRDFTLDPTQDLLVLLRASSEDMDPAEVHFRSLRTNEKHPAAKHGVLMHELFGSTRAYTHSMQVCQDLFAVLHIALAGRWPEKLVVYNWKKGELVFEISFCGIMSYAFLSERHILFAVQPFNVMPACQGDHQPRLLICDIDRTAALSPMGHPEAYAAVCELHLPELKQYVDVVDILIRADPAPNPFSSNSSYESAGVLSPPAFSTAPHNRLFVINFHVATVLDDTGDHRASENLTLGLFVPLSTFLPFMCSSKTEPEIIPANSLDEDLYVGDYQATPPRRIAAVWEDWMRYGSRALLVPGAERVWVCNVFGMRCVHALEPRDAVAPLAPRHVAVLDFNTDALRRDRVASAVGMNTFTESDDEEEERGRLENEPRALVEEHTEPSTLETACCGIFEGDVTTSLPYRRTVLREKVRFDGVMLTEDNIIFVNRRAPKEFEVLTF